MSIAGQEIPIPTEEEIVEANAPREKSQNKKHPLAGPKARITAAVLGIGIFSSALAVACGGGAKDTSPTKTPVPTNPAGVNVIQMTPTGAPIETATIADFLSPTAKAEATKTAQPTQTPKATNTHEPAQTSTPENENLSHPYEIELSDQLKEMQSRGEKLRSGVTPEEFVQKLTKEVDTYPKVGNLKIKLFIPTPEQVAKGENNHYFYNLENGGPYISLSADQPIEKLSIYDLRHEFGHHISIKDNGAYLRSILSLEEYNQLEQIENDVTHDPQAGLSDEQDPFTIYFSSQMLGANSYIEPDAPLSALQATSRRRMLGIKLSGVSSTADQAENPFLSAIQKQLDEIHAYAASPDMHQRAEYIQDASQTLDRNQAFIDKISAENPIMAEVYKDLRENQSVLTAQNMQITANSMSSFRLTSPLMGQSFEQLSYWGAVIFLEKDFKAGKPIIVNAYKDKTSDINQNIAEKDNKARIEGYGDAIMVYLITKNPNLPAAKAVKFFENKELQLSR